MIEKEASAGSVRCYGSSGNTFASFMVPQDGEVSYFTLVHNNGGFTCDSKKYPSAKLHSIWGCFEEPDTILTTLRDKVLDHVQLYEINFGRELNFNFHPPYSVNANEHFRIWTRASFSGKSVGNDIPGQHCVKVVIGYKIPD